MEDMVKIITVICCIICLGCNPGKIEFGYLHLQTVAEMFAENQYIEIHLQKYQDSLYYQFHDDIHGIQQMHTIPLHELNNKSLPLVDTLDKLFIARNINGTIYFRMNTYEYEFKIVNEISDNDIIRGPSRYDEDDFWARRKNYIENELILQ